MWLEYMENEYNNNKIPIIYNSIDGRKEVIVIYLTLEEKNIVMNKAKGSHVSASSMLRQAFFSKEANKE